MRERLQSALGDRYSLERELGRGGMATVFLAHDPKHKRSVAIKVLAPEIARTVGPARFLREIEIAAQLTHPHILPVFDSGEFEGLLYYVMPYVQGESLRQRLAREGRLTVAEAVLIAREVADALDYAHRRGIVHRDIKPENVLLDEGHAIVADFGVARALSSDSGGGPTLTEVGLAIGTPYYMSPEQAMGDGTIDGRTDLYALGCMLYEMLAGRPVFEGPTSQAVTRRHLLETPTPVPGVPEWIQSVVSRALAKDPKERWATGAEMVAALGSGKVPARRVASNRWFVWGSVAALALAVVTFLDTRRSGPATLDQNLVAVAPFDVLVSDLHLWREGLVDVLSRNLDGAGPLRTVAPTVVVRGWGRGERADVPSATALARRTGAGLAVFGQLLGLGRDSVRLSATLYDVSSGRSLGEFQLVGVSDRMDRIADSLTVNLLRELSRTRPIGAVRFASLGSSSLPAMKAFLQGEQFYRRTDWDSAVAYYERAIAIDSTFSLAYHRIGLAYGWQRAGGDSASRANALRAGAFNHGLPPRESLLVSADSLSALLFAGGDTAWWTHARRLFATLESAAARYPDDPEVWYALGDARYHFGTAPVIGATPAQTLEAFDRSIALDSAFGPAYIHPVALELNLGGPTQALRYIRPYLALNPTDINAQGIRILERLIDPATARLPETERMLDTTPMLLLGHVLSDGLSTWPDSGETGLRVQREHVRRHPSPGESMYAGVRRGLASGLAYRGHLRESAQIAGAIPPSSEAGWLYTVYGLFGVVPADSVERVFQERRRTSDVELAYNLLPWLAARGDTAAVRAVSRMVETLSREPPPRVSRGVLRYAGEATQAYLALARRDSAEALRRFLALPDTLCPGCYVEPMQRAHLLAVKGRDQEAAAQLERQLPTQWDPRIVLWTLEGGRVNERLGNRDKAVASYRFVTDVWVHADPELQPFVEEAKAALVRLGAEPRR